MTEPVIGENEVTPSGVVEKVFPPLDQTTLIPQVFWLGVIFVCLYLLLARVIIPRIGAILKERRESLETDLNAASRLKEDVDKAVKAYDKTLTAARTNAHNLGRKILDDLATDIQKERTRAEKEMGEKLAKGEKSITDAKQQALTRINDIALDISQPILNQILGKNVSQEDIKLVMADKKSG